MSEVITTYTTEGKQLLVSIYADKIVPHEEFFKARYVFLLLSTNEPPCSKEEIGFSTMAAAYCSYCLKWTDEEIIQAFNDKTLLDKVFDSIDADEINNLTKNAETVFLKIDPYTSRSVKPTLH